MGSPGRMVDVRLPGDMATQLDPRACPRCGSSRLEDRGTAEPGVRDYKCRACGRIEQAMTYGGKPIQWLLPGDGPETAGYRNGGVPSFYLPSRVPCGCKRSSPQIRLVADGNRVCEKHGVKFRLQLIFVEVVHARTHQRRAASAWA